MAARPRPTMRDNVRLMRAVLSDPAPALDELRRSYGPVVELGGGGVRLAVIGDPVVMREMFAAGADAYQWGHRYNVVGVRLVVGKGSMIVSDGADHARRRRASQSAFSRPKLDGLVPMIVQRTDVAIDALARSSSPGQELDLYPVGRVADPRHHPRCVLRAAARRPRRRDRWSAAAPTGLHRGAGARAVAAPVAVRDGAARYAATVAPSTRSSTRRSRCAGPTPTPVATTCWAH